MKLSGLNESVTGNRLNDRIKILFSLFIILIVTAFSCCPVVSNGFTNWDDDKFISTNSLIHSISSENIAHIFSFTDIRIHRTFFLAKCLYVPLTLLSFAVEYHFFQLSPAPYHITNLVLHLINSLLVFWLIYLLRKNIAVSLVTSLLFGIHPLHIESVAWISARKDVLYGFFFLLSLIYYIRYLQASRRTDYLLSLFMFLLSALSKPMALTLPVILVVVDYVCNRKIKKDIILEKIPFFVLSFFFVLIAFFVQKINDRLVGTQFHFSATEHAFLLIYRISFYVVKMFAPFKLSCYYPQNDLPIEGLTAASILSWVLIFTGLVVFIFFPGKKVKIVAFGVLFYMITIFPTINVVPGCPGLIGDRYTYIPLIGLFCLVGEAFSCYALWRGAIITKVTAFVLMVTLIGFLSYLSRERCMVWRDSISLWSDVIKNYPCISVAYENRGAAYFSLGENERAIDDFTRGIQCSPYGTSLYYNRAIVYASLGDYDRSIEDFSKAIKLNSSYAPAFNGRGFVYFRRGEYKKALRDYNAALCINSNLADAYKNRGLLFVAMKEPELALIDFTRAIENEGRNSEYFYYRAMTYQGLGDFKRAIDDYSRAIGLKPDYVLAYNNRGFMYHQSGDFEKAIQDYNSALSIKSDIAEVYQNRGLAYFNKGEYKRAIEDFSYSLSIDNGLVKSYIARGIVYDRLGDYGNAIEDFSRALIIQPDNEDAYFNRALTYYHKKDYEKVWQDVETMQSMGFKIDPRFLDDLRKSSDRRKH